MRQKDGDRLRVGKTLSLFLSVSFVPIYEKSRGRGNFSRTKMPAMLQAVRSVQLVFTSFSFRCCRASKYFFLSENGCRGHTHTHKHTARHIQYMHLWRRPYLLSHNLEHDEGCTVAQLPNALRLETKLDMPSERENFCELAIFAGKCVLGTNGNIVECDLYGSFLHRWFGRLQAAA